MLKEMGIMKEKLSLVKMSLDAKHWARRKLYREYWYDQILKEPEIHFKYSAIKDKLAEYANKRTGQRWKYFMVTINFKIGVDIILAKARLNKCLKKIWIKKAIYCWEWRKINEGMHIHMRIEPDKNKKIYDCKREIYNTFKHLVGNKLHVNMRYSNLENCFIDYIMGYKDGKIKDCIECSRKMRTHYNLKNWYETSIAQTGDGIDEK